MLPTSRISLTRSPSWSRHVRTRRRHTLRALSAATAVAALAAGCSSANSGANKGGGAGASGVLTLGKPDGPQTNNSNPFLSTSASATLGYRT